MRARSALLAAGQSCELREVVLRDKPPELLAASPAATVPVLVLPDGRVIAQSLEIMLWALGRRDPQAWLAPGGGTLADMRSLIDACDTGFKRDLDRYKYPERASKDPGGAPAVAARESGAAFLLSLEARLAAAPFLFGPTMALADAAIAPFVRQFAGVDRAWFAAQPWPRLQAWLAAWEGSDAFDAVMQRHPAWKAGAAGVPFPAGR